MGGRGSSSLSGSGRAAMLKRWEGFSDTTVYIQRNVDVFTKLGDGFTSAKTYPSQKKALANLPEKFSGATSEGMFSRRAASLERAGYEITRLGGDTGNKTNHAYFLAKKRKR